MNGREDREWNRTDQGRRTKTDKVTQRGKALKRGDELTNATQVNRKERRRKTKHQK